MLKAPGFMLLKLRCDGPLSNFGFNSTCAATSGRHRAWRSAARSARGMRENERRFRVHMKASGIRPGPCEGARCFRVYKEAPGFRPRTREREIHFRVHEEA